MIKPDTMRNGQPPHFTHPSKELETTAAGELFKLNCDLTRWARQFQEFIALPSAPYAPRGRFGLFAEVEQATHLSEPSDLEPLLNATRDKPAIFLLGYEFGRPWLNLPRAALLVDSHSAFFLELGASIQLDGMNGEIYPTAEQSFTAPEESDLIPRRLRLDGKR